ncbi:MAG: hypothetical protein ABW185_07820, partial [Sedimenticola sp.]
MMLGREVTLPVDLMFPSRNPREVSSDPIPYVAELEHSITRSHQVARGALKSAQKRMKGSYDLTVLQKSYEVGDPVYVLDTSTAKGKAKKLCPPWKGPGIVLEKITPAVLRVKTRTGVSTMNHDRLKKCNDRVLPAWIVRLQSDPALLTQALVAARKQTVADALFCSCRRPDDGKMMIQCEMCLEWYHIACLNLTERKAKQIDKFSCPSCLAGPLASGP